VAVDCSQRPRKCQTSAAGIYPKTLVIRISSSLCLLFPCSITKTTHPHLPPQSIMSSIKPLILHAHTTGPNPIKIAIALEKLKLPYEVKLWEFGDNAENGLKGAKFLEINENGRVPALQDPNSGVVSWESGAIMNYVRRKYDTENILGPQGKTEQDVVDFEKWEYFLLTTLGPHTGQRNWYTYLITFHPFSSNYH
jgi:hypothetical protein